jgi:methylmalonyl-CoA mutase C-terminal domain/subunit
VLKEGIKRFLFDRERHEQKLNTEITKAQRTRGRMADKKIRVLIAKPGLDGHDRGAKIVARALRDAGMEVIYTGLRQTPEMIASAAAQEDVDVIGLSILSGAHNTICPRLMELLREKGMSDVTVLIGGIIPESDIPSLKQAGIAAIFLPGTPTQQIIDFVRERAAAR